MFGMAAKYECPNNSMLVDSCQSSIKGDPKEEKLKKTRAKRPDLQVYVPRGRRQEQETEAADHVVNPKCAATVSEISSGHKESQKVSKSQSSSKSRLVATSDNQITDNPNDCQDLQGNTVAKAGKQSKTCDVKSSRRKSASKVKLSHKIITVTHVSEPPTSTPLKSKTAELELNSGIQPSVETQTKSFSHDASHFKTYHVTSPCDAGVIVPNGTWRTSEEYAFDDLPVLTSHVAYQSELHETNDNSASINVSYQGILLNESHHAEICEEVKMNATSGMSENEISQDDQLTNNNLSPVVNPAPSTSGSQCLLENELCTAVDVALGTTNSSQESSQYTSAICQCKSDSKIRSVCDSLPTDSAVNAHFAPLTALLSLTEKTSCNTEISVESSGPESAGSTKVKLTVPADFDCSVEGEGNKDVDVSMQQVVDTLTASASDDDDWDHIYDDSGNSRISEPDLNASSTQGHVTSAKPYIDYYAHQPNDPDISNSECGHLIEIYDFPPQLQTCDLLSAFVEYRDRGFDIKWVDDTHAIGVFSSSIAANSVLGCFNNPLMKVRSIESASRPTKLKAKRTAEFLQPYKARPETTATVARNLVAGALGLQNRVSREKREEERKKLKEAKERKREVVKLRDDAWDGNIAS